MVSGRRKEYTCHLLRTRRWYHIQRKDCLLISHRFILGQGFLVLIGDISRVCVQEPGRQESVFSVQHGGWSWPRLLCVADKRDVIDPWRCSPCSRLRCEGLSIGGGWLTWFVIWGRRIEGLFCWDMFLSVTLWGVERGEEREENVRIHGAVFSADDFVWRHSLYSRLTRSLSATRSRQKSSSCRWSHSDYASIFPGRLYIKGPGTCSGNWPGNFLGHQVQCELCYRRVAAI